MTQDTDTASGAAEPDNVTRLPDGSAFAIASFPLPDSHWLYAPREYAEGADVPKELPRPILNHTEHREAVVAAIRYAVRGATMCGKEPDFDPDALVQNAVYALCGPFGGQAPAQADRVQEDVARLDFLQECGATIEVLPGRPGWTFRVGGLHGGVHRSVRAAIDAERKLRSKP